MTNADLMTNAYWFIPSKVNKAIDSLQDLGYVIDIEQFRKFTDKFKTSKLIIYRHNQGLTHSISNADACKKANPSNVYIDLLGPKEPILTDEYRESQNSFAELCNPTEYIT